MEEEEQKQKKKNRGMNIPVSIEMGFYLDVQSFFQSFLHNYTFVPTKIVKAATNAPNDRYSIHS